MKRPYNTKVWHQLSSHQSASLAAEIKWLLLCHLPSDATFAPNLGEIYSMRTLVKATMIQIMLCAKHLNVFSDNIFENIIGKVTRSEITKFDQTNCHQNIILNTVTLKFVTVPKNVELINSILLVKLISSRRGSNFFPPIIIWLE